MWGWLTKDNKTATELGVRLVALNWVYGALSFIVYVAMVEIGQRWFFSMGSRPTWLHEIGPLDFGIALGIGLDLLLLLPLIAGWFYLSRQTIAINRVEMFAFAIVAWAPFLATVVLVSSLEGFAYELTTPLLGLTFNKAYLLFVLFASVISFGVVALVNVRQKVLAPKNDA